ncbi:Alpha-N-acetylgalactosaminide alpha-2,6-sialyltransferase 5 [Holothuria leucospilota]|uniref:Alpha-N-acetylgalactosaminide alpha-2,6-sialyltransferase 5 n=1 Tax=Holothuria leucospilota TaxID=206669 RepID=A0A9Q1BK98_HOLLE|nr:Alpha-N-acetylgalactosaminide alpha-2,6-sialyltransferase 5 [Holothuria leucospilota]
MEESFTKSSKSSRCLSKKGKVIYLVVYTAVVGLAFLSYLYSNEGSRRNTIKSNLNDDVIVLPKSSVMRYMDSTGIDGKLLVKMSFPRPGHPAAVLDHYKSMRDGTTFRKKCDKCALVFSSGHLLESGAGKEIDSMPCVIRMNAATTEGFEDDVGRKTTVRMVCHMSAEPLTVGAEEILGDESDSKTESVLVFGLSKSNHNWAAERIKAVVEKYPNTEFYSMDEVGEMESDLIFEKETGKNKFETNTWLSTGWYSMLAALDICKELHVYGMVDENYCQEHPDSPVRYHYYQSFDKPTECDTYDAHENKVYLGGHRFITEKAIFSRWAKMFNIHFHHPTWSPKSKKSKSGIRTPFVTRSEEDVTFVASVFHWFVRSVMGFTT